MTMHDKIEKTIEYMKMVALKEGRDWITPTEIGRFVGGPKKHSSYGSPICLKMVELGIAEKNNKGWYKLT